MNLCRLDLIVLVIFVVFHVYSKKTQKCGHA